MSQYENLVQSILDDVHQSITLSNDHFLREYRLSVFVSASRWIAFTCFAITLFYCQIALTTGDNRAYITAGFFIVITIITTDVNRIIKKFGLTSSIRLFMSAATATVFIFSVYQSDEFVIIGALGAIILITFATLLEPTHIARKWIIVHFVIYVSAIILKVMLNVSPINTGQFRPVLIYGVPILVIIIMAVSINVSIQFFQKNLEHSEKRRYHLQTQSRALEKLARELERSNNELENFAYIASHDLHEPLRKISVFSNRLKMMLEDKLEDNEADYFERLISASTRMQSLIDDLLAFSRVGVQGINYEQVDLTQMINEMLDDFEIQIAETNAQITVPELPIIQADSSQMRHLFQNLIGNALKYRRPDVATQVTFHYEKPFSNNNEVIITVEDNGIGFEPDYAERIFSIFQRLHGREAYEGSGIGLAICRKIVEQHGGTIAAVGQPDYGAKFIIHLPIGQSANNHS